jgi:hypothetical protein
MDRAMNTEQQHADSFARELRALDMMENVLEFAHHDISDSGFKVAAIEFQERLLRYRSDIIDAYQTNMNQRTAEMLKVEGSTG